MIKAWDLGASQKKKRAGDGIRTHDNDVGNVVLYQLSYTRPEQFGIIGFPERYSRAVKPLDPLKPSPRQCQYPVHWVV